MDAILRVEMLPAEQGDCLWVEYGDASHPHRILIDAGTPEASKNLQARLAQLPESDRHFDLLIVTHIDNDHIGGVLELLGGNLAGLSFDDIWFNAYRHLPQPGQFETFGPVQGEKLSRRLDETYGPWNKSFGAKGVVVPDDGPLSAVGLPGGMKLTLLSPGPPQLSALIPKWKEECAKAKLDPATPPPPPVEPPPGFEAFGPPPDIPTLAGRPFRKDSSEANGSAIAVLAEFEGRRVLLGADAHAPVLQKNIERLLAQSGEARLKVDAFKLPHHGSRANLSPDLLRKVECPRYLFSTNGAQFKHPDKEAVARAIVLGGQGPELVFNYCSEFNSMWDNAEWIREYGYRVAYPADGAAGKVVEL